MLRVSVLMFLAPTLANVYQATRVTEKANVKVHISTWEKFSSLPAKKARKFETATGLKENREKLRDIPICFRRITFITPRKPIPRTEHVS